MIPRVEINFVVPRASNALYLFQYGMDNTSRGRMRQVEESGLEAKQIAIGSKPHDLPDSDLGEVGMLAKTFATSQVGEMHFDGGNSHRGDGIAQRYTRVGICAGVDDQRVDTPHSLLYGLDEASFMIGLQDFELDMVFSSKRLQAVVDFVKGHEAINPRFAATE